MSDLIKTQIEAPQTIERFSKIFGAVQKVDPTEAQRMFEVEKFHFMKELQEKNLSDVAPVSAMGVFLDVVSNGMSFSSSAKHVYLMKRNVKVGDKWEPRLVYSTSPDGKIYQAQRAGSLEYITKPVIVYEGDEFAVGTNEQGNQIIRHQVKFPRQGNNIIAGYVYVVFKNGNREPYWMDLQDIERLKGYSARQNKTIGANALYTSNGGQIDPGFFGAKLINFALKNVRKSVIASQYEVEETEAADLPPVDENATFTPAMVVEPPTAFTNDPQHAGERASRANNIPSPIGNEPF